MDPITKGLLFLAASWILFAVAIPVAKRWMVVKWDLMDEVKCRKQLKKMWDVLLYSHVGIGIIAYFFFSQAQKVKGFADQYLDYMFVLFAAGIVLQFVYTAVKEHTEDKFGVDPVTPTWWKVLGPVFRAFGKGVDYIHETIRIIFNKKK
jgi:hypothetical protein